MNAFVLDCSVTMAWCFEDEQNDYTSYVLKSFNQQNEACVPKLWRLEVTNVLLLGIRKKIISHLSANHFKQLLLNLPIKQDNFSDDNVFSTVFEMAHELQLTSFDATYLEIAFRQKIPLATQDTALIRAAHHIGVSLF
jgi:predicted nucleic acid-binding protein